MSRAWLVGKRCCGWRVQVWDVSAQLREVAGLPASASTAASPLMRQAPLQVFTGHPDEGFAMDWSPVAPGKLVTGETADRPGLRQRLKLRSQCLVRCVPQWGGLPCRSKAGREREASCVSACLAPHLVDGLPPARACPD